MNPEITIPFWLALVYGVVTISAVIVSVSATLYAINEGLKA